MTFQETKPPLIIIAGPTGIGKTTVAIELAERFNGEIIGADAMQVYRHMDIGTAKPAPDEQARIAHHMIDVADPNEDFDAGRFARSVDGVIADLAARGKTILVAGGTGLYIKALVHGLVEAAPSDESVRRRLRETARNKGTAALHARLRSIDPKAAEKIHINDAYRIIRALEVHETTGAPISRWHREHGFRTERYQCLKIGLSMEREQLYDRINQRVDAMIDAGLLEEVRRLLLRGHAPDLKSMQSLGYRHMIGFITGRMEWEETVRTLKRDHRRYAKRQMTWFRADPKMIWMPPSPIDPIARMVASFLDEHELVRNGNRHPHNRPQDKYGKTDDRH